MRRWSHRIANLCDNVLPLFGFAVVFIGWMYILLDAWFDDKDDGTKLSQMNPKIPEVLIRVGHFTLHYWILEVLQNFS
jgi:hypothetical protein